MDLNLAAKDLQLVGITRLQHQTFSAYTCGFANKLLRQHVYPNAGHKVVTDLDGCELTFCECLTVVATFQSLLQTIKCSSQHVPGGGGPSYACSIKAWEHKLFRPSLTSSVEVL